MDGADDEGIEVEAENDLSPVLAGGEVGGDWKKEGMRSCWRERRSFTIFNLGRIELANVLGSVLRK